MLTKVLTHGLVITKAEQKTINGGKNNQTDCITHAHFCNDSHPNDDKAYWDCMDSCGCYT